MSVRNFLLSASKFKGLSAARKAGEVKLGLRGMPGALDPRRFEPFVFLFPPEGRGTNGPDTDGKLLFRPWPKCGEGRRLCPPCALAGPRNICKQNHESSRRSDVKCQPAFLPGWLADIYLSVSVLSVCLSVCLSVDVWLSVCLLPGCLSAWLSSCLSVWLSGWMAV